jgi:hypothetical protein
VIRRKAKDPSQPYALMPILCITWCHICHVVSLQDVRRNRPRLTCRCKFVCCRNVHWFFTFWGSSKSVWPDVGRLGRFTTAFVDNWTITASPCVELGLIFLR